MISKREAAIISAYTGFMLGDFSEMHKYIEEILGRPVMTHELGDPEVAEMIRVAAKPDFILLGVDILA